MDAISRRQCKSFDPIESSLANLRGWLMQSVSGRFPRLALALTIAAIGTGRLIDPAQAQPATIDAAAVQQAIDRGIAYLRSTQNPRGGWKEYSGQSCGLTSLTTLALLTAGVPPDDPTIAKAIAYLRAIEASETYSVALQTLVFCQVGAPADLARIRRNVAWLEKEQMTVAETNESRAGGWGYGSGRGGGDPSNSQFALLALQAAEERDVPVSGKVYSLADEYWRSRQTAAGAWGYGAGAPPTGSMTCAGIASVVICRGRLGTGSSRVDGTQIVCCGGQEDARDPVEAGLRWLGDRFSVQINPGNSGSSTLYYYLYAMERVGRMTGRRFIGGHDWYREGAQRLIELQDQFQGFWSGVGFAEDDRNVTTSFALLFLAKGKRQVVMGRLRYGERRDRDDGPWHAHPDASRQLVRRLERNWGRDLTWQNPSLEGARVDDLLQTPVLIISGGDALGFRDAEFDLLKDYVDQGGCILFEANAGPGCGPSVEFARSVREACERWFGSVPLEPLPPTHPVYTAEADVKPDLIAPGFQLYGVQACCRTAVFFSPTTLTCRWELSDPTGRGRPSADGTGRVATVADSLETAARLGQNVIAYATGRELKDKLDSRLVIRSSAASESRRGVIRIGRLAIDAGAEEARRALPNFVAIASDRVPIRIDIAQDDVPLDAATLADYAVIWMHGRSDFVLDPGQRQELKTFLDHGGILIADSICANEAFAIAVRRELAAILGEGELRPLAASHPAFTSEFGGFDLRSVTIRTPSRTGSGMRIDRRRGSPQIEAASVDGVTSVFFSPLDLSCALESQNSIQCSGYDTGDASRIGINLMLYALQH